jgi:hypothetical protein
MDFDKNIIKPKEVSFNEVLMSKFVQSFEMLEESESNKDIMKHYGKSIAFLEALFHSSGIGADYYIKLSNDVNEMLKRQSSKVAVRTEYAANRPAVLKTRFDEAIKKLQTNLN